MPSIVLATVNAKFQHAAFGLRYLLSNLRELREHAVLKEWSLGIRARDVVEELLALEPTIVGFSVYIWNSEILTEIVTLLKKLRPSIIVVLGGPEVSYEWEEQTIFQRADYLVRGEGEVAFLELCRKILAGDPPPLKAIPGGLPLLGELVWPYQEYNDFDLEHGRVVYVEASRGCPFQCAFCLSSLDKSVRAFELEPFLEQMEALLKRGVKRFKFVDRTFNLKASVSERIMSFFLERYETGMFLHFEMIPDRLPESLRPLIRSFPPGVLQFEVGIQSFDPQVCDRIGRRQKFSAIEDNLRFLDQETGVHVHADLIAGLPGEDLESFGRGFDRLYGYGVAEIQVGILKRLRGTPITTIGEEWGMIYSETPPYEVLRTAHLSFFELQRLQRFARYWDLVSNSGRYPRLTEALLSRGAPFETFLQFSDWLFEQV
ncbi:MAG TPA: DUF4080 domain-containing protein, partial [Phycisphaerales bacterium]|nr:DUF4080 domain-containing protein [Phycisphaerales bacterium]